MHNARNQQTSSSTQGADLARALSYAVYDLTGALLGLAALPLLPLLCLTRYRHGLGERLGWLPAAVRGLHRPVWVHAASVGEVLAAAPLVQRLRAEMPGCPIVVSTTSVTGRETARARLGADAAMLLPADIRCITNRVMRLIQPRCVILVETELWPALLRAARRCDVPAILVSGRISERSARRYAWVPGVTRAMLSQVSRLAMQTEADAARIIALGAPAARVLVVGSLKLAREAPMQSLTAAAHGPAALALGDERPVFIAASTHPGEEDMVLDACSALWEQCPEMLLVIAPRRPERFDEVAQLLARAGVAAERRSQLHGSEPRGSELRGPVAPATRVLLLDTLGELPDLLPMARAVFVGGTIAAVGGHNILEPGLSGKPVAFGPHTANVAAAAEALLENGAATLVHDAQELRAEWLRLLAHPEIAGAMGASARAVIDASAGVAERTLAIVRACMREAAR